jgi:hypothetical protein
MRRVVLSLALALAASSAFAQKVHVDYDKTADFHASRPSPGWTRTSSP